MDYGSPLGEQLLHLVYTLFVPLSVRENVCNISKKRKKSCFLDFQKKRKKT